MINDKDFDLILELCNLEVSSIDKKSKYNDIISLLDWVNRLNEIDTKDIKPLQYFFNEQSITEADISSGPLSCDDVLQNAPNKNSNYILIPRVK